MKRLIISLMAFMTAMVPITAEETIDIEQLVVEFSSGETVAIDLQDSPVLSFSADTLVATSPGIELRYPIQQIAQYYFTTVQREVTGITQVVNSSSASEQPTPEISDGKAGFSGLKVGSKVVVYTIDGRVVTIVKAQEDGTASVDLNGLGSGIYILQTSGASFKINHK